MVYIGECVGEVDFLIIMMIDGVDKGCVYVCSFVEDEFVCVVGGCEFFVDGFDYE